VQPILRLRHFTDPACPFAYSAEPVRQRLRWTYGEQIAWEDVMVVLSRDPEDYLAKGFTTEMLAQGLARFARQEHMPIDPAERPRMAASADACRAVVAARLHAPGTETALLRALRTRVMAGGLLDDPELIARAAIDAGLEPEDLVAWMDEPDTDAAFEADAALARDPSRAAVAMAHKLAANGDDGWRYTCPSYEISRWDDPEHSLSVPGFQPYAASEVAISNLAPELERRGAAESALEVLEWAGEPLAAIEVAAIRGIELDEAREELARIGVESPVGLEGWWTPRERVHEAPLVGRADRVAA
jgi:predicted DsbA family dithiol-disulfide isomerase